MAEKNFYWLKLMKDFFTKPKIKKLRRIAGGDTYTIIYLKMQLLSLENEALIKFQHIEDTIEEEIALTIDEDVDNVSVTLNYLLAQGLIEKVDENSYLLTETVALIGSETSIAQRVRKYREKQKMLQCNADVTICNTEIEKEKDINIELEKEKKKKPTRHKYGEYGRVLLTDEQYNNLKSEYSNYNDLITFLDEYIEMKGYKAKNHYLAIKKWVVDAVNERKAKQQTRQDNNSKYYQSEDDDWETVRHIFEGK